MRGKYAEALKCYNQAIDICPADKKLDLASMLQNRVASYEKLVRFLSFNTVKVNLPILYMDIIIFMYQVFFR